MNGTWPYGVEPRAAAPGEPAGRPLVYVGIATVRGDPASAAPVYAEPSEQGTPVGSIAGGGYAPHFRATEDHAWLEVTLPSGRRGWLRNDPSRVDVTLPDPARLRVVIDPGHGGPEPGAQANGLLEKDVNLDIALKLQAALAEDRRIERVWLTRTGDQDASLEYRWDLANGAFPALFVSVHANASADPEQRGTETYYKCGTEATEPLAAASKRAACLIHLRLQEQIEGYGSADCPWVDRGVICRLVSETDPRSYYFVLQNTNAPAVLIESAYLSNPGEARCLASEDFRARLARAIYQGVTDALFTDAQGDNCSFRTIYGI